MKHTKGGAEEMWNNWTPKQREQWLKDTKFKIHDLELWGAMRYNIVKGYSKIYFYDNRIVDALETEKKK